MMRLATLLLLLAATPAFAVVTIDIPGDPSSCGIVIPDRTIGSLQGDLDCTGKTTNAIELRTAAKLYLNGHTIVAPSTRSGVYCWPTTPSTCVIEGPGSISGGNIGIRPAARVRVRNLDIHHNGIGIETIYGDLPVASVVELQNVDIHDNVGDGIAGGGKIRATDVTIQSNGGVGTTSFGPSRLVRTTITGNGSAGIVTGQYKTDTGWYPYTKRLLMLVDSTVTGNGLSDGRPDLLSGKRPSLKRSTCGTSADPIQPGNLTWGVCSGD
jgi:hypothetical protein